MLGDMEDGVNGEEGRGKLEGDGVGTGSCYNRVRSEVLFGEFLCGSGGADELCSYVDGVSDLEIRSRQAVLICLSAIADLGRGDIGAEVAVELVEVHGEITGPGGGKVAFRVDC